MPNIIKRQPFRFIIIYMANSSLGYLYFPIVTIVITIYPYSLQSKSNSILYWTDYGGRL